MYILLQKAELGGGGVWGSAPKPRAASPQECCWWLRPKTPAGVPPQTPLGAPAPSPGPLLNGFWAESQRGFGKSPNSLPS